MLPRIAAIALALLLSGCGPWAAVQGIALATDLPRAYASALVTGDGLEPYTKEGDHGVVIERRHP